MLLFRSNGLFKCLFVFIHQQLLLRTWACLFGLNKSFDAVQLFGEFFYASILVQDKRSLFLETNYKVGFVASEWQKSANGGVEYSFWNIHDGFAVAHVYALTTWTIGTTCLKARLFQDFGNSAGSFDDHCEKCLLNVFFNIFLIQTIPAIRNNV